MSSVDQTCDVLVVGSGVAGLCAALAAHDSGLRVVIAEKASVFGGTSAFSAGVAWIPANSQARALGIEDSPAKALQYLRSEIGSLLDEAKAEAFVECAAKALDYLLEKTHVRFSVATEWPDYHPDLPGGCAGGRSLSPEPFDGQRLGDWFPRLRMPLRSMMAFGGMSVGRNDLKYVFTMRTSVRSFAYVGKLVMGYAFDRLRGYPRGTRLVNGNALVARLALSVKERGIPLWLNAPLQGLEMLGGRVVGAELMRNGKRIRVSVRRAVVLACGGRSASQAYRAQYPHVRQGGDHYTVVPESNTGDGITVAVRDADADVSADVHHHAAWAPVSLVPLPDGSVDRFPHFIDRGKPGFIAVDPNGMRFVNESLSYHDFVPGMIKACRGAPAVEAFLICDHRTVRRFGIGAVPPAPGRLDAYLRSGYLFRGQTLEALADVIGVDASRLERTVGEFNADARRGVDTQFKRGSDAYQRFNGSTLYESTNPTLAPIERGPFYAVRLVPGDIGSFSGLRTNARAQVLDKQGACIPGLYACGNDMTSVMGGTYPGAGITIGPALTFAHLAARDIRSKSDSHD